MAKKINILKGAVLSGAVLIPVTTAYANSVRVTVNIAPVANVRVVSEQRGDETIYTATVVSNSIKGFDLLVSSDNGETYEVFKTVEKYVADKDNIYTAISGRSDLKFKAVPHL